MSEIPGSINVPGVYIEFNTKLANSTLPTNEQKLLLIGQRTKIHIEPAMFQGGTLNDMTSQGTYTGTARTDYLIEIDVAGTPDTFKWSKDAGLTYEATGVSVTAGAISLDQGVTVTFGATTGHAVGDQWLFPALPEPTVAEKVPTQAFNTAEVSEKCGPGSMAHLMSIAALKTRQSLELFFCSLDDNGSNFAAGDFTVTGTITTAGSWIVRIGGKRAEIAMAVDDTAAEVAIAMQNKLAELAELPATVNVNTATPGKLDLIAKNAGAIGNQIKLTSEIVDAVGISVAVTTLTGGSTDPDIDDALGAVFTNDYDRYAFADNAAASITKVRTHLNSISGPLEVRPATAFFGSVGTPANSISLSAGANSGRITNIAFQQSLSIPYEIASAYAAEVTFEEDPAQPLNGRELIGLVGPVSDDDKYTNSEQETLLGDGVSPIVVQTDGRITIVRDVTTYTNVLGVPSVALKDGTTQRTLDFTRESVRIRLALVFQGAKNTAAVRADIRDHIIDVLQRLEDLDIVKNVDDNKDGVTVVVNGQDVTRVDTEIPVDTVNGLHVIAGPMNLLLT